MYVIIVVLSLLVCPAASVVIQAAQGHHSFDDPVLIARWWTFWAVGIRLFIAGIRQVIQPRFTTEEIFRIRETKCFSPRPGNRICQPVHGCDRHLQLGPYRLGDPRGCCRWPILWVRRFGSHYAKEQERKGIYRHGLGRVRLPYASHVHRPDFCLDRLESTCVSP